MQSRFISSKYTYWACKNNFIDTIRSNKWRYAAIFSVLSLKPLKTYIFLLLEA